MGNSRATVADESRRRQTQLENRQTAAPTAAAVTSTLRVTAPSFHPTRKLLSSTSSASTSGTTGKSSQTTLSSATTATTNSGAPSSKKSASQGALPSSSPPPPPFQSSHMALPPPRWLLHMPSRSELPTSSVIPQFTLADLGQEIRAFNSYNALSVDEHTAREHILSTVQQCVTSLWGLDARAFVFGSYALDLSLPESDVDIAVLFPKAILDEESASQLAPEVIQQRRIDALHALAAAIHAADPAGGPQHDSQQGPRYAVEVIDQCRVPVIQLRDLWTQVRCDICVTRPQMDIVVEKQKAWLAKNTVARDLILMTKAALKQWGLNQAFTGGLSSTCVYSLVHRFLREEPIPSAPCGRTATPTNSGQELACSDVSSRCQSPGGLSSPTSSSTHEFEDIACKEVSPSDATRIVSPLGDAALLGPSTAMVACASSDDDSVGPDVVAKQLLMFWGYLTHDLFSSGYFLSDAFRPDGPCGGSADGSQLPVAAAEGPFDISKSAFRLGEAQLLFRHSIDVLVQLLGPKAASLPGVATSSSFGFMGCAAAVSVVTGSRVPSLLFPILVDPRQQSSGEALSLPPLPPPPPHMNRRRQRHRQ